MPNPSSSVLILRIACLPLVLAVSGLTLADDYNELLYEEAVTAFNEQNTVRALELFQQVLNDGYRSQKLLFNLSAALYALGQYSEALHYLRQINDPGLSPQVWWMTGLSYARLGNSSLARTWLQRAANQRENTQISLNAEESLAQLARNVVFTEKRYQGTIDMGLGNQSGLDVLQSDNSLSTESDSTKALLVTGSAVLGDPRATKATWEVGMVYYQNIYGKYSQYDVSLTGLNLQKGFGTNGNQYAFSYNRLTADDTHLMDTWISQLHWYWPLSGAKNIRLNGRLERYAIPDSAYKHLQGDSRHLEIAILGVRSLLWEAGFSYTQTDRKDFQELGIPQTKGASVEDMTDPGKYILFSSYSPQALRWYTSAVWNRGPWETRAEIAYQQSSFPDANKFATITIPNGQNTEIVSMVSTVQRKDRLSSFSLDIKRALSVRWYGKLSLLYLKNTTSDSYFAYDLRTLSLHIGAEL